MFEWLVCLYYMPILSRGTAALKTKYRADPYQELVLSLLQHLKITRESQLIRAAFRSTGPKTMF